MLNKFKILILFLIIPRISTAQNENIEKISDTYLAQRPPGIVPELFAPEIISVPESKEFGSTFSPDGTEFYFTRSINRQQRIWFTKQINGLWTKPALASFASDCGEFEPHYSYDGKRLYFSSQRPITDQDTLNDRFDIWFVSKMDGKWSKPEYFGRDMMYLTTTESGTIYFTDLSDAERLFIAKREWNGESFEDIVRLSDSVNCFLNSARPFIAPDESYILFDGNVDGDFNTDIYVSFKKPSGGWTKARKLGGSVNTNKREVCAYVTRDGRFLFFSRFDKPDINIYWVDSEIIGQRKPAELR